MFVFQSGFSPIHRQLNFQWGKQVNGKGQRHISRAKPKQMLSLGSAALSCKCTKYLLASRNGCTKNMNQFLPITLSSTYPNHTKVIDSSFFTGYGNIYNDSTVMQPLKSVQSL